GCIEPGSGENRSGPQAGVGCVLAQPFHGSCMRIDDGLHLRCAVRWQVAHDRLGRKGRPRLQFLMTMPGAPETCRDHGDQQQVQTDRNNQPDIAAARWAFAHRYNPSPRSVGASMATVISGFEVSETIAPPKGL